MCGCSESVSTQMTTHRRDPVAKGRDPIAAIRSRVTEEDINANSTLQSIDRLSAPLETLFEDRQSIDTIVDLGCGYGGFSSALGDVLGADRVYGVDTDEEKRAEAQLRGLETFDLDVESDSLPFDDDSVDLVICFGLLEHLRYYDRPLTEINRVLREEGWLWLAVPNLSGWTNRFALLVGYQPRSVELSDEVAVGVLPWYPGKKPIGHVHAPTYRALRELLDYHGFDHRLTEGLHPYQRNRIVSALDRLLGWLPTLARRVTVLAQRRPDGST